MTATAAPSTPLAPASAPQNDSLRSLVRSWSSSPDILHNIITAKKLHASGSGAPAAVRTWQGGDWHAVETGASARYDLARPPVLQRITASVCGTCRSATSGAGSGEGGYAEARPSLAAGETFDFVCDSAQH